MRSTFSGLNTMVNGIYTNRLSLDTVGHNISNSKTEGYSRQQAHSVATMPSEVYTLAGCQQVGNGSTVSSVARARDIYADRQFWKESGYDGYYNAKAKNYGKIESIFNDSHNTGIQERLEVFYKAWQDVSTTASSDTSRQNVINAGQNLAESLTTAGNQVKQQIGAIYDEITLSVDNINSMTNQLVSLNKNISSIEATGAIANDLRDQRDLLVDKLSSLMNVNVYETSNHMYTVVCNGTTLVNGISRVDLEMSEPINNEEYSLNDYNIMIKQTGTIFAPATGELQGQLEAIKEDKAYIDQLASMGSFLFTTLNDQHKVGYGIDGDVTNPLNPANKATTQLNFYGETKYIYSLNANGELQAEDTSTTPPTTEILKGMQVLEALVVNSELTNKDGHRKLATRGDDRATSAATPTSVNGTGDGSNAVWISALFNCEQKNTSMDVNTGVRSIGEGSLFSYYNTNMTTMGSATANMNNKVDYQATVMTQVENLRSSTNGVNWDEELTNMIMFQQGYQACSRCLNAMDECLDKLVNGTGVVGR